MKAVIRSIAAFVPSRTMSNDELTKFIDTSDEWIVSHTGIRNRHIAQNDVAASDIGLEAAKIALNRANIKPEELDMIICATATPDYYGFPSTACVIQGKIGAVKAGAFDITAACSGFVYALELSKNFIVSGKMRNILVITPEVLSKITNWKDRNTCVLFGDGAGACIISADSEESDSEILYSILRAEGEGAEYLKVPAGGSRMPHRLGKIAEKDLYLYMDGQKVYNFAVRVFTTIIKNLLSEKNLSIDDVNYIVPHQANIRIIEGAAKRLKISIDKFYTNIEEYANTSGASIPIALNEMSEKGILNKGDLILTAGFGGGLTYGGNIIRW